MAPKHGLSSLREEETLAKRAKSSETPASRSATPADLTGKVPFKVHYPVRNSKKKLTKKEQELVDNSEWQVSPFEAKGAAEGELDQDYSVTPNKEWESMKKYNNFIIQGEVYKNNHFVFVRGEDTPKDKDKEEQPKDFWVARILQVRAKNAQHVYALVAWMYWPEEIPQLKTRSPDQVSPKRGQMTYHGGHELIASNHMEVLDVLSFAGKADVFHWLEEDDNLQHKLYWRQTLNRKTEELSEVRKHCICGGHFNPEVAMYICDNPTCKVWLHKACLIDDVLTKTYKKYVNANEEEPVANGNGKKSKARKLYDGKFEAKIQEEGDNPPTMLITDLRPGSGMRKWVEGIACPKCGTVLQ